MHLVGVTNVDLAKLSYCQLFWNFINHHVLFHMTYNRVNNLEKVTFLLQNLFETIFFSKFQLFVHFF